MAAKDATTGSGLSIAQLKEAIAGLESGGNYTAKSHNSSASGKYQFVKGTWDHFAKMVPGEWSKYSTAASAPPAVQEAMADAWFSRLSKKYGGDVRLISAAHFQGEGVADKLAKNPSASNPLWTRKDANGTSTSGYVNIVTKALGVAGKMVTTGVDTARSALDPTNYTGGGSAGAVQAGTAATMGAAGTVAPIDLATILSQAGQMANQPIQGLPDINSATSAYQQQVQQSLAQQLQNLDAQFAQGQKGIADRASIFNTQLQQATQRVGANATQNQATLSALTDPSIAAQAANDAAQNAGRAGYGFGALPGTTGGLTNIASAGAQQIAGGAQDLKAMMEGDFANIGKLIQAQGQNDLALGKLQLTGQAQQKANSAVSDYIASMNAERVKALTDYALSTPERQAQFANLLLSGSKSNQDANAQDVQNAMTVQKTNADNYNDMLKLQAQLNDSAAGRDQSAANAASSAASSAASRAQSAAISDRNYALSVARYDEQVRMNNAKLLKDGASTGVGGLKPDQTAKVSTAISAIDTDMLNRGNAILEAVAKNPNNYGEAAANAAGSPGTLGAALALQAYDPSRMNPGNADAIMRKAAAAMAAREAVDGSLAKTGVAKRGDDIYKEMRGMYDRISLTDIPQGRAYVDKALDQFPLVNAISNGFGTTLGQQISGLMSKQLHGMTNTQQQTYVINGKEYGVPPADVMNAQAAAASVPRFG